MSAKTAPQALALALLKAAGVDATRVSSVTLQIGPTGPAQLSVLYVPQQLEAGVVEAVAAEGLRGCVMQPSPVVVVQAHMHMSHEHLVRLRMNLQGQLPPGTPLLVLPYGTSLAQPEPAAPAAPPAEPARGWWARWTARWRQAMA